MLSDGDLLRQYLDDGSQAAFTTLVQRHINVVYRTALRRVGGNAHAADDATQRVFTALACKAGKLRGHASLAGWLYTSTRFAAAELVRAEQRRRKYEQEAHTMNELTAPVPFSPERLEPLLDEIMERIPERDREALLLHFFERRSFVDIGAMFSSTADATRMRVNRALDRLRAELERRGIASTGVALSAALSSQATNAATLPDAGALAVRVAASVGSSSAAGVSVVARAIAALRNSPMATATGVAVAVVAVWVGHFALAGRAIVSRVPPTASASAPNVVGTETNGAQASLPPAAPAPAVATATPAVLRRSLVDRARFARMSTEEQNLLVLLWREQVVAPAGTRPALGVGLSAPNIGGVDRLIEHGLVGELPAATPGHRRVHLTAAGIRFCESIRDDIETYRPTARFRTKEMSE